jgi:hypothetical protein
MRCSYVLPMRWMVIYEYEVPGGALNLSSTKLPRPWLPWESSPSRKNPHVRAGNRTRDIMFSSQKLWPLDNKAGLTLECNIHTCISQWLKLIIQRDPVFCEVRAEDLEKIFVIGREFEVAAGPEKTLQPWAQCRIACSRRLLTFKTRIINLHSYNISKMIDCESVSKMRRNLTAYFAILSGFLERLQDFNV